MHESSLKQFASVLEAASATRSRLEKRRILSEFLRSLPDEVLPLAVTYLCGRAFPRCDSRTLSAGGAAFSAAILQANPEKTPEDLHQAWLRHSDGGDTAADLWQDFVAEGLPLSLGEMHAIFNALYEAKGPTGKLPILAAAFRRMNALEIRAFVKVLLNETRIGVQEGTVEDAVAAAFSLPLDEIRAANRHRADLGAVALEA